MNSPEEAQNVINQVKAESYDQMTSLNRQLSQMAQQLNSANALVGQIAAIVDPENGNLTQGELIDKLNLAFKPKNSTDKELKDERSSKSKESEA